MDDDEFFRFIENKCSQQEKEDQQKGSVSKVYIEMFDRQLQQIIDSDDGRTELLKEVECQKAMDFDQVFNSREFLEKRFQFVAAGSFGNALILHVGRRRSPRIIKAIRCLPRHLTRNFSSGAMSYKDVHRELICLKNLFKLCRGVRLTQNQALPGDRFSGDDPDSNASNPETDSLYKQNADANRGLPPTRQRRFRFQTNCFPRLYKAYLCCNETEASYNFESFYAFDWNRPMHRNLETAILVMEHCGKPLDELMRDCQIAPCAILSILKQMILGLAIAESIFYFEHRDLHLSNVTCLKTKSAWISFVYKSQKYRITSVGFEAKIIDFSYSRLTTIPGQQIFYKDLTFLNNSYKSTNLNMAAQSPDNFAGPYDEMASVFEPNKWYIYSNRSNMIWIKYLIKNLINEIQIGYGESFGDETNLVLDYLDKLDAIIARDCEDLFQLFNHLISDEFNTIVPFKCR